jgi:drug/metabolite transporter (DMT)-like permease
MPGLILGAGMRDSLLTDAQIAHETAVMVALLYWGLCVVVGRYVGAFEDASMVVAWTLMCTCMWWLTTWGSPYWWG